MKKFKQTLIAILALILCLSLCACGSDTAEETQSSPATTEAPKETPSIETAKPIETPEENSVTENTQVVLEGIYADTSYVAEDGSPLKMVYVFATIKAGERNMSISTKYQDMTVGANTYSSDFYKNICMYMPNYYYSSFLEDVYVGEELKTVFTFKIPTGDLQPGKEITLSDDDIDFEGIKMTTDEIVMCNSVQEIGQLADPEGCTDIVQKMQPASEQVTAKVRSDMNGYYWSFYVSAGTSIDSREIEFFEPNSFEVRSRLGISNTGTYEVREGFIICSYSEENQWPVAYEYNEAGQLCLYLDKAFSIYE